MRTRFLQAGMVMILANLFLITGCKTIHDPTHGLKTPAEAGLNSRDLVDVPAQKESDRQMNMDRLVQVSNGVKQFLLDNVQKADPEIKSRPAKNVLCLSGGGSYGAFSAGILYGWTATGCRPQFDTVTGISTGALISPLAFLGSKYDDVMKSFYTESSTRDIYKIHPVTGLFKDALADNSPLAKKVDDVLTPQLIEELGIEYRKGRRLYVGTTELESKRFVIWDLTEIASRDGYAGKDLIKRVLLGSSAIPGFFPPSRIPVTVDGRPYVEKHGDGGVSQGVFMKPPFLPPTPENEKSIAPYANTNVYCIMAGKLYSDPAPVPSWSLNFASTSVSAVIYAQTRGDLIRIYTSSLLSGMNFNCTAIPEGFNAPKSATEFEPAAMTSMFEEGCRLIKSGQAWRSTPPGCEPGETARQRSNTCLVEEDRGPKVDTQAPNRRPLRTPGLMPIPAIPGSTEK